MKAKYIHMLRAMRAGDVLYLPAKAKRFDRQVSGTLTKYGARAEIINVVAVHIDRVTAEHLIRITMKVPIK